MLWLAVFQCACLVLYLAWWRALVSCRINSVVDNSDWLLAFIFLKLPAVFAAGATPAASPAAYVTGVAARVCDGRPPTPQQPCLCGNQPRGRSTTNHCLQ